MMGRKEWAGAACAALAAILAASCDTSPTAVEYPYSSRVAKYYAYGSDGQAAADPAFTVVYDGTGTPSGRFEMTYDADGRLTRTDLIKYGDTVTYVPMGYYRYTYDASGLLVKGEACAPDGTVEENYVIAYNAAGNYTSVISSALDSTGAMKPTDSHYVVWDTSFDPQRYVIEQYFTYNDSGVEVLQREYQAYYDSVGTPLAELYHVVRSSSGDTSGIILPSGSNEGYYFTQFAYNDAGLAFLQSDSWYGNPSDAKGLPTDLGTNYPSYNRSLVTPGVHSSYAVNPSFIGNNAGVLMTEYDSDGDMTKDSTYLLGTLKEMVTYSWAAPGRIAETSRYASDGKTLTQRDSVRYYDATVGGKAFAVAETTTYYLGSDVGEAASSSASSRLALPAAGRGSASLYRELAAAASSGGDILRAYGDAIFRSERDMHHER